MDSICKLVTRITSGVGTPRALAVKLLAEAGEWSQLQSLRLREPDTYRNSDEYFKDALVTEFLRKCDLGSVLYPNGDDPREKNALETFAACEAQCTAANIRLSRFLSNHLFIRDSLDERVYQIVLAWRKEIKRVLPRLPASLTPRFSGGATYADGGKLTTLPDKMSSVPTLYRQTTHLLDNAFWGTGWGRACMSDTRHPKVVRGNIFFTVPKDSEKFRGCAKEASISVSLQLDAARYLRKGLLRVGIDLRVAAKQHERLACLASRDGSLATLDMSNASDTLCKVLPGLVLPEDWSALLDSLRATHTRVNGQWHYLAKYSSMGNGFTFELETLLFSTLARVLCIQEGADPDLVSCVGDDLIVPTGISDSVIAALEFFGFTLNRRKSFTAGRFRESCGGDYFDGQPVRAYYMKELPDEPQDWIALANGLRRVDPHLSYTRSAWRFCVDQLPNNIRRCRGPEALGDLVIHTDPEEWEVSYRKPGGLGPLVCGDLVVPHVRSYQPINQYLKWHHWKGEVVLACTTLGQTSEGVIPRNSVVGYKLGFTPLPTPDNDPRHWAAFRRSGRLIV